MQSGSGVETATGLIAQQPSTRDNRAAPAATEVQQARQDSNPDRRGWSSPCCSLHHEPVQKKRTTRVERASPELRSGALPAELHPPRKHARLESNQRPLPSQSSALPLSYGREQEPPAGVEPAPRPYKGRVLAVDTTEARERWRWSESNRHPPRCKRGARPVELHPRGTKSSADGEVEPPHREAPGVEIAERYNLLSSLGSASARRGGRPDSNRHCEAHDLECSPLHHSHHERGRPDSNRRPLA
jgi:hypothetical protein